MGAAAADGAAGIGRRLNCRAARQTARQGITIRCRSSRRRPAAHCDDGSGRAQWPDVFAVG